MAGTAADRFSMENLLLLSLAPSRRDGSPPLPHREHRWQRRAFLWQST